MIEVQAAATIRTSQETVWRHLLRVGEWPRWYPGLHGVAQQATITGAGDSWSSSGQMGRLLYRETSRVSRYERLDLLRIESTRKPWIARLDITFEIKRVGANTQLHCSIEAEPGFGFVGRLILSRLLRRRLQREAEQICDRLRRYAEYALPHH